MQKLLQCHMTQAPFRHTFTSPTSLQQAAGQRNNPHLCLEKTRLRRQSSCLFIISTPLKSEGPCNCNGLRRRLVTAPRAKLKLKLIDDQER